MNFRQFWLVDFFRPTHPLNAKSGKFQIFLNPSFIHFQSFRISPEKIILFMLGKSRRIKRFESKTKSYKLTEIFKLEDKLLDSVWCNVSNLASSSKRLCDLFWWFSFFACKLFSTANLHCSRSVLIASKSFSKDNKSFLVSSFEQLEIFNTDSNAVTFSLNILENGQLKNTATFQLIILPAPLQNVRLINLTKDFEKKMKLNMFFHCLVGL